MRPLALLLCLLVGCIAVAAPAARRPITRTSPDDGLALNRYVDLAAWGRSRGLTARVLDRGEEIRLANRGLEIVFRNKARKATFDGTEVRLTEPVRKSGTAFQVASRDVQTLLDPLLNPPRRPAHRPIRTVAINAGHGGKDPGNIEGRRQEKLYTLLVATDLKRRLERAGLRVHMVRSTDVFVDLDERPARAQRAGADLYVSIHFNGVDGRGASEVAGVETYCLTPAGASSTNDSGNHGGGWHPGNRFDKDNIVLAHQVHRAIVGGTDLNDRGLRRARFRELTLLDMPGLLIEGGYMTNAQDAASIYSTEGRTALSRAIADGILAYKRLVERAQ